MVLVCEKIEGVSLAELCSRIYCKASADMRDLEGCVKAVLRNGNVLEDGLVYPLGEREHAFEIGDVKGSSEAYRNPFMER